MWVLNTINKTSQISKINMKHSLNQEYKNTRILFTNSGPSKGITNNLNFNCKRSIKKNIFEIGKKTTFYIETIKVDNNYYDKK